MNYKPMCLYTPRLEPKPRRLDLLDYAGVIVWGLLIFQITQKLI